MNWNYLFTRSAFFYLYRSIRRRQTLYHWDTWEACICYCLKSLLRSSGCMALEWLWGDTPLWGQRSPSKMTDMGMVAAWHWSDFEEISNVQGQRRSPSKMVGGARLRLESNPIPTRDAQRAQTHLVSTRTQRPHRDWARTVFGCRCRSAVDCRRGRGSGAVDLGMA